MISIGRFFILIILIAVAAGAVYYFYFRQDQELGLVIIGPKKFTVEIADNDEERRIGLSRRETIGNADGMLFVFDRPVIPGFWMKDVKFPLDIIWIQDDRIVDFIKSAPPANNSSPQVYYPPIAVRYVLELPGGTVERHNIDKGQEVKIWD